MIWWIVGVIVVALVGAAALVIWAITSSDEYR